MNFNSLSPEIDKFINEIVDIIFENEFSPDSRGLNMEQMKLLLRQRLIVMMERM